LSQFHRVPKITAIFRSIESKHVHSLCSINSRACLYLLSYWAEMCGLITSERDDPMKQFFLVRWFGQWKRRRIINRTWILRKYPPCRFCERPIPEMSPFCNWCGAAQIQERQTSEHMEWSEAMKHFAASQQFSQPPTTRPGNVRIHQVTRALLHAPLGERPLKTFQKLIRGER
jgi:hypothetical protein